MAITATTQWEVQTTGNDANGGGFDPTKGGTDYTYGAGQKTIAFAGGISATTTGASATITITGYTVLSGDAGNVLSITGGTNFIPSRYLILSVNTGANTWTLDRNCTTGVGTTMTGTAGGALASPGGAAGIVATANVGASGQIVNVKSGTYSIGTGTASTPGNRVGGTGSTGMVWWGYGSTHGDGGVKPVLQAGGNSITLVTMSTDTAFQNFEFQKGSASSIIGIAMNGNRCQVRDCKFTSLDSGSVTGSGNNGMVTGCEVSGQTGGTAGYVVSGGGTRYVGCAAHGCSVPGFSVGLGDAVISCLSYSNTSHGFTTSNTGALFDSSLAYSNTGASINGFNIGNHLTRCVNCLSVNNGGSSPAGYGFASGSSFYGVIINNCGAYGNNGGDTTGNFQLNIGFQSLSGDPCVNGAGGNFALNNTAGAGAACRAAGWPSSWPGLSSTTGYPDIGPVQTRSTSGQAVAF